MIFIINIIDTYDYRDCDEKCIDYHIQQKYALGYNKILMTIYNFFNDIGIQTSPFYLDE